MQTLSEPPGPGPAPGAPFGFGHLLSAICQAQDIVDNGGFTIAIPGDKRCPLGDVEKKKIKHGVFVSKCYYVFGCENLEHLPETPWYFMVVYSKLSLCAGSVRCQLPQLKKSPQVDRVHRPAISHINFAKLGNSRLSELNLSEWNRLELCSLGIWNILNWRAQGHDTFRALGWGCGLKNEPIWRLFCLQVKQEGGGTAPTRYNKVHDLSSSPVKIWLAEASPSPVTADICRFG